MVTKTAPVKTEEKVTVKKERYFEGRGGRKTAIARARIYPKGVGIAINEKDAAEYFKHTRDQMVVASPFELL